MSSLKGLILLFLFSIIYFKANAQTSIGSEVGMTINRLHYQDSNTNTSLASETGYAVNLIFQHHLNKYLLLEGAFGQLEKNYISKGEQGIYLKAQNTYLQLPVSAVYFLKIGNRFSGFISLGLYNAYWYKGTTNGLIPDVYSVDQIPGSTTEEQIKLIKIRSVHDFDSQIDRRFEFGWLSGAGLNYNITRNVKASLKGQLFTGLTGQERIYYQQQSPKHNQTIVITSGISYGF
ncbi:MAG TPA: outer membrane beta-barrel protein [Pedobacter sp.]